MQGSGGSKRCRANRDIPANPGRCSVTGVVCCPIEITGSYLRQAFVFTSERGTSFTTAGCARSVERTDTAHNSTTRLVLIVQICERLPAVIADDEARTFVSPAVAFHLR